MNYYDIKRDAFIMENYHHKNPFANFLPGVAGKMGIPLWVFYVNRGQGVSGFGLNNKHHPIMPFTPANKAYETVSTNGFRTFYKVNGSFYEPFMPDSAHEHKMIVERSAFTIEETNRTLGLKTTVTYFGLPQSPLAGLIRTVSVENIGSHDMTIEMLDGIAEILPAGVRNDNFKAMSNLLSSWMDVKYLDENLAFYVLRGSTDDSSEVNGVEDGNFYLGFDETGLIRPIVDQRLVFGQNTAKTVPLGFLSTDFETLISADQIATNKIPCGFIPYRKKLKPNETIHVYAISGHAATVDLLKEKLSTLTKPSTIIEKRVEAKSIIETLLNDVASSTAQPMFDAYVKQNYLDNFLRGGYPEIIGNGVYHLYSRRHGDLERDYNFFSLAPEYYSQGGGNFRDVCQNRRLDTFLEKEVGSFNIHHFASLIQLDGYNPLTVNGTVYTIKDDATLTALLKKHFSNNHDVLEAYLKVPWTPGGVVNFINREGIIALHSTDLYLADLIDHATAHINATYGEGFWVDHFTYVLDLIETYESIYPDKMETLLYDESVYAYFDAPVTVRAKAEKIVLNKAHQVRQYGSLRHFDQEKIDRQGMNPYVPNWAEIEGERYYSNLFTKLLVLVLNKHSLLDPDGLGIEMEADKPGWNDAMNGLPGLFGSGVSETIELWRIIDFLLNNLREGTLVLPIEIAEFFETLKEETSYDTRLSCRESYREKIRFGLAGAMRELELKSIRDYLETLKATIEDRLETLFDHHDGMMPTFLTFEVIEHEPILKNGKQTHAHSGYPLVRPTAYRRRALPPFLEAPARLMKTSFDRKKLKRMHEHILESEIYDQALKMYKTSAPLKQECLEIGRIHAFTPGWLERESNFLHMTYKYLLGLLKAGLYEAYYETLKTNLVCFMDPNIYGRNPLENSSFIAPSNNPDPMIHGQGFFARLSGSTVETLNMWTIMMTGGRPFRHENGELVLRFEPKLPHDYFKTDRTVSFTFLKNISVTYVNASLENTFDRCDVHNIALTNGDKTVVCEGSNLRGQIAEDVRNGLYETITIYMN